MSQQAEKSSQSIRALSAAEIHSISGATYSISLPNLDMEIWADSSGYGANMQNGKFYYSISVKT